MTTTPAKLFVSYARQDQDRVAEIVKLLAQSELGTWVDTDALVPGDVYGTEIVKAIQASRAVLFMVSKTSLVSRNVHQELKIAWDANRPIIPVRLEPVAIPDDLKYWLEGLQFVDVSDPKFEELLLRGIRSGGTVMAHPPKRLSRLVFRTGLALVTVALIVIGLILWNSHEKQRTIETYEPFVAKLQRVQRGAQDVRDQWRSLSKVNLVTPNAHQAIWNAQDSYYKNLEALDDAWKAHVASPAFDRDPGSELALRRVRDAAWSDLHDKGVRSFNPVGALINDLEKKPPQGNEAEVRTKLVRQLEEMDRQIEDFSEKVTEYIAEFGK